MFHTVLVANRGEIAVRILKTLRRLQVRSVAVYSDVDRSSPHVALADVAVPLGGSAPIDSYLRGDLILQIAKDQGAQAIIPGYGFLSENAEFAEACEVASIVFVGPPATQIRQFGHKHASRSLAARLGVPRIPGTGLLASLDDAVSSAHRIGYPVMVKSTAGGGGIGLAKCDDEEQLRAAFESVRRLGKNFFNDAGVFLERFVPQARHLEVQIFGDGRGQVIALGERDCSVQRRNQKLVEETPAPDLPENTRRALWASATALGQAVSYRSAGTVEFLYNRDLDQFYFLEVNTRLQVEHPVTEGVTGLDLVEWMLLTAAGTPPVLSASYPSRGASMEVRLYAEDPGRNFQPSPGTLTEVAFPPDVRVDGWVRAGTEVSSHYDSLLAKLIVQGADRADALKKLKTALDQTRLYGIATNLGYLRALVGSDEFQRGSVTTRFLDTFQPTWRVIEVVEPGTYTTVQDYPGRVGYWNVGVPPSGPMDDYAFRLANRIVGNPESVAGLECTIHGPSLRFHLDAVIAVTGAETPATLDGVFVSLWAPVAVKAGQILRVGKASAGCRSYVAVRGGLDVPPYLGSKSTFVLGKFGGHCGRPLRPQDTLAVGPTPETSEASAGFSVPTPAAASLVPHYSSCWEIGVLAGPHGAPDFFTKEFLGQFFKTDWEVHYNSNRLGIRLLGPKPSWARSDGGEAGLHPSNIHDCEYAIGSINFTGDMPIILTHDGPSLGGFVCPVTVAKGELWKVGQVKPGDKIRFRALDFEAALALEQEMDRALRLELPPSGGIASRWLSAPGNAVLASLSETVRRPRVTYRQAGDKYILLEYGPMVLDLRLRFRVFGLMETLQCDPISGILELAPGVRSLQIQYDSRVIHQKALLDRLIAAEDRIPPVETMKLPTRVVHMPLAFEDSATLEAVAKYRQSVRNTAPWLPNNVEFIRRINGLDSRDDVRNIIFQASYMVLGLGDVYLGAPCAVPVDPRHRLLTSKYNPARTFTAEGTVGIGGVYMCIYGMDSPGGYQLVGRTLPIWNTFLKNPVFVDGEPWLLKFFDQVRFYPVEEQELARLRESFREGQTGLRIEHEVFDLGSYDRFLKEQASDILRFQRTQQAAFVAEVSHWQADVDQGPGVTAEEPVSDVSPGRAGHVVKAEIHGNVWEVRVKVGDKVEEGQTLLVLEAMKMENWIQSPLTGTVKEILCQPGRLVSTGDPLLRIEAS